MGLTERPRRWTSGRTEPLSPVSEGDEGEGWGEDGLVEALARAGVQPGGARGAAGGGLSQNAHLALDTSRIEYSLFCVRRSSLSPEMAAVAGPRPDFPQIFHLTSASSCPAELLTKSRGNHREHIPTG